MVVIDSSSGKTLAIPDWPSNSRYAYVVAANDHGVVIETGDELKLLSPALATLKQIAIPPLPADRYGHEPFWNHYASWSGRHLLLTGNAQQHWRCLWIDARTLEILKSWEHVGAGHIEVSDDALVTMSTVPLQFPAPPTELLFSKPEGTWAPILGTENPTRYQFVGSNLLYFATFGRVGHEAEGGVFLMRTDTNEVSRLTPSKKGWGLGQAAVSRAGDRFVILEEELRGRHPTLDISGHAVLRGLVIYDAPFNVPSQILHVQGPELRNPDNVALSPDGRHLAVLSYPDPILEIFDLSAVR
jgi:hypothetical protein